MITLLNFIGKNKYTFDCIIISNLKISFIYWILEDSNFQNVIDGVFTSLKTSGIDGYLTEKMFILIIEFKIYFGNIDFSKVSKSWHGEIYCGCSSVIIVLI